MKRGTYLALLATLAAAPTLGQSRAEVATAPVLGYAGHCVVDQPTRTSKWSAEPPRTQAVATVYDNLGGTLEGGAFTGDLGAVWGDSLVTIATGKVEEFTLTILNGFTSGASITQLTIRFTIRNAATWAVIGSWEFTPNYPGVPPGYFATATLTGIGGQGIVLDGTTIVAQQTVTQVAGNVTQLGVATFAHVAIGESPASMYLETSVIPGGFYELVPPDNPGYRLTLVDAVAVHATSWGRVKELYR